MMTLHKLSAGDGYLYYTREVASADEYRAADRQLGDYYHADGNPPGQWGGAGAVHLGVTGVVTEAQMAALFGEGIHPDAEALLAQDPQAEVRLGQRYKRYQQGENVLGSRINTAMGDFERMEKRSPGPDDRRLIRSRVGAVYFREMHARNPKDKEELGRFITAQTKPASQAVAGYDLVFAPAKSASVLWAVGGDEARKAIEAAHHEAIEEAMAYLESEAVYTRRGRNGVRQEDVEGGLVYTTFRHYDSRNGDPQLHDHVVVSNKVMGKDGRWSSLDGALLYKFNVAASEHYNRRVMEKITERLGVGLVERPIAGKRPIMEIAGVDLAAIEAASSRRTAIKPVIDELVKQFTEDHGYAPNSKQMIDLAQQATLTTRPVKKEARQLSALVHQWKQDLSKVEGVTVGPRALTVAREHRFDARIKAEKENPGWMVNTADEVDPEEAAQHVIGVLERSRGSWGAHHIEAETRRHLGSRFGDVTIPANLIEQVTARATDQFSLLLTPGERTPLVDSLRRLDGSSKYSKAHRELYTSSGVLHSEDRLLEAAQKQIIPAATGEAFERALAMQGKRFDAGQLGMAREFACSDKLLRVGVGPAGAGKTTALRLAADTINEAGGKVIALAPTAAAAAVMSGELGATATTIDSFVLAHQRLSPDAIIPSPGDVIIIDEAGMVGTGLFAAAVTIAEQYGAVVRALGDDQQLSAVGSGGALRLIRTEAGAMHLEDLHRFRHPDGTANEEEAAATLALREPPAIGTDDPWTFYRTNHRIVAGDVETMTTEVFEAWQKDTNAGKNSVMMAFDNNTVTELNARAQSYRLATEKISDGPGSTLRDGLTAHVGDVVVTRKNNRLMSLNQGKDFVKNNDVWTVTGVHTDGSLSVQHRDHSGTTTLPGEYVRESTMLGYAATIHRTQGMTCDTTHAMLSSELTRSLAYVAASRGRESNHLYGALADGETLDGLLDSVAANHDTNLTAHELVAAARAQARSIPEKSAAYLDVDDQANLERMKNVARRALGDGPAQGLIDENAWEPLARTMLTAEKSGVNVPDALAGAYAERGFSDAVDSSAVMVWRLEAETAGTVDMATGERPLANVSDEHLETLGQRAAEQRVRAGNIVAEETPDAGQKPWIQRLYGHLTDDALDTRIKAASDVKDRQIPSDPQNQSVALSWQLWKLNHEKQTRQQLPEDALLRETLQRGGTDRVEHASTILDRIHREQLIRQRIMPVSPASVIPDGLPEWIAPAVAAAQWDTPVLWRQELLARREEMVPQFNRLGSELAAEPPTWAQALGPVPSDTQHQEQWRQLAAEVAVYREQYRIPVTEATAIPAEHRDKDLGSELNARITAMHKYTQQTAKEPLSRDDARLMHEAAEVETRLMEEQVPAEQVIDHMRTERAEESTLTAEQARAERIAELSRRLKASRQKSGEAPPERSEAYKTALAAMKQRRKEEGGDRKEGDSDGTPISKAAETARKARAYREEAERDRQQQRDKDDISRQGDDRGPRYRR
ncbi:MobF family relaxase [Paeniglutamicibacter antarcticus]|uniref:TrwC relaxase domain-containing protein n=1 Tax=Paeniglutamicibacter antarcticus TaxID=494023 RepID=A0ABP9TKY2_9MICC